MKVRQERVLREGKLFRKTYEADIDWELAWSSGNARASKPRGPGLNPPKVHVSAVVG